jgi:hypothetical protein
MPGRRESSIIRSTSSFSIIWKGAFTSAGAKHAQIAAQRAGERLAHHLIVVDD